MKVFKPLKINEMEVENRVGVAPMCTYLSDKKDGVANELHLAHYTTLASGLPGLIIQEATAINDQGYISDYCLGIYHPRQKEALSNLVHTVHRFPVKFGIQLNHAGGKSARSNVVKVGPSQKDDIKEASVEEIEKIIRDFESAAKAARVIGYDFIEIHAAHGYLLNQFLSPITNKRQDEYGKDKALLLTKVIEGVKKEFTGPIFVRISAVEYAKDGNTLEDSVKLAKLLKSLGVDLINVSSGGFGSLPFEAYPLFQVPYATEIKNQAHIKVATAGIITKESEVASIIEQQQADIVLLAREFLRNPFFLLKWKYQAGLLKEEDTSKFMIRALKGMS